ncbi:MAG: hypothetical protein EHM78_14835 [Myxococcaceae bacterium]|nr:MAG: hypothetical protein EHM78_14835 [Myxococcaceae bacterium]
MKATLFCRIIVTWGLGLGALTAAAQSRPPTTEQLGRDPGALRQEAEQQRAQETVQQQQGSQQQADQQWNDALRQNQSRAAANTAQGEAVRRSWQQRPPLAPDHNPLLGRWESLGSGRRPSAAGVSPEIAKLASELIGGMTSGLCDSMLGHGTIEFRPAGLVAIGSDGREHPMYRAEYRGGGSRVVVLPQGGITFTHMIIDFSGRDRATVAVVGCGLRRVGGSDGARPTAMTTAPAADGPAPSQWMLLGTTAANGGMDVYVSRSTIRRSGSLAKMADLWDFKTRHEFEGNPFLSARNHYEYDCARSRRRMLATTGFSGHMGQGTVVGSSDDVGAWEPVGTSGVLHDHWKVACTRQ